MLGESYNSSNAKSTGNTVTPCTHIYNRKSWRQKGTKRTTLKDHFTCAPDSGENAFAEPRVSSFPWVYRYITNLFLYGKSLNPLHSHYRFSILYTVTTTNKTVQYIVYNIIYARWHDYNLTKENLNDNSCQFHTNL